MQLKLQRSQRMGGVLGNTVVFCLDVRADYSPEEQSNIRRYKMGSHVIYNSRAAKKHLERVDAQAARAKYGSSWDEMAAGAALSWTSVAMAKMSLNISIASLGQGHHIECKDLDELLEAEDTVRNACKGVTRYLEVAATFDGSEVVIEYDRGEEQVHIAQNAPPLITYEAKPPAAAPAPPKAATPAPQYSSAPTVGSGANANQNFRSAGEEVKYRWFAFENRILAYTTAKGWTVNGTQVRIACGIAAFLVLALLLQGH